MRDLLVEGRPLVRPTRRVALGALLLFLLNIALNRATLLPGESPYRQSIELSYVAMARWVQQHPDFWGWKPLQYLGIPTAMQYVPAVPYTVASLSSATGADVAQVHRVLTVLFTSSLPVVAALMCWYFQRSLGWAIGVGIVLTFFSPLYDLLPAMDKDRSPSFVPWRWHLLMKYGEGPHNIGLALMPLTVVAVLRYAKQPTTPRLLIAAGVLALVPLINWVAALGLAITMLAFLAARWAARQETWSVRRVLFAAFVAYCIASFALTPTFVRTIAFNWPVDSPNFHAIRAQQQASVAALAALIVMTVLLRSLRTGFYTAFVTLAALAFGIVVLSFGFSGLDILPESHRYAMEFELFLVLAAMALIRAAWNTGLPTRRLVAGMFAAAFLCHFAYQPAQYLTKSWSWFRPVPSTETVEYRMAQWLNQQKPRGRILTSGGLRFRMTRWFDLPMVGGGFESGLRNRTPVMWASRIRHDVGLGDTARRWLQQLGVEYVVVHGPKSTEFYRDYRDPAKFEGKLQKVYEFEDNRIYRVPFESFAARGCFRWTSPSSARLEPVDSQPVVLSISFDPGWSANQNGARLAVARDRDGFLVVNPKAARSPIQLEFGPTTEQVLFAGLSVLVTGYLLATTAGEAIRTMQTSKAATEAAR
ncbi:MAG TPA: hypothetical protein VE621_19415, partial [Bryobacteraceae bacterium]|nr:hypothetical protein [Bryobacteraceae bacterium]